MKFSISKLFLTGVSACTLGIVLCMGATPVNADSYPGLEKVTCMADAWEEITGKNLPHDSINCTANDVEITKVIPLDGNGKRPDDPEYEAIECTPEIPFTMQADITVRTNANERYNPTFYLPRTPQNPQDIQIDMSDPNLYNPHYDGFNDEYCSMILPMPNNEGNSLWPGGDPTAGEIADVDLDGDSCGDITKANLDDLDGNLIPGSDEYTLYNESVSMICLRSPEDPTRAEFTYCAAWSVSDDGGCDVTYPYPGIVPSQKSKCNCDSFPIDVFIKPDPPRMIKELIGTNTRPEFGGEYTFKVSIENLSSESSLFIQSLTDEFDVGSDGTWDGAIDLWSTAVTVPADPPDGAYLTDTNCEQPADGGKILASDIYQCQFTVHIVDSLLPGLLAPELYDDVFKALFWDKTDTPVINGTSCSDLGLTPQDPGEHCSNLLQVEVTNVMPDIRVSKGATPNSIVEPGGPVTFDVEVFNDSLVEPLILTSLMDDVHGNLDGQGDCSVPQTIAVGDSYPCSFTADVLGNARYEEKDTVTATGEDNEENVDSAEAYAIVKITDDPSEIELIKTADPTWVWEPGDYVTYTFTVKNLSTIDIVTITALDDTIYGDLTTADGTTCSVPQELTVKNTPGDSYTCTIYVEVLADAADDPPNEYNEATAYGIDDDGRLLEAFDDALVTFRDVLPTAHLSKDVTKMIVTYKVVVTNDSGAEELYLDVLNDDQFGDITTVQGNVVKTDCVAGGGTIAIGDSYTCYFDGVVTTSPHTDVVTGTVSDNDGNDVTPSPSDDATVEFY